MQPSGKGEIEEDVRRNRSVAQRGVLRGGQFVGDEFVVLVEAEGDSRGDRLESIRIDVPDDGDDGVRIMRVFHGISARAEKENDARRGSALGQLGVEQEIDFAKLRVGSVSAGIAADGGEEDKQKRGQRGQSAKLRKCVLCGSERRNHLVIRSVHNFEFIFFNDRVG